MSSPDSTENKRILYLQQIEVETAHKRECRVKLQIDGKDIEVRREERRLTWTPSRSLELPDTCKITLIIKAGHTFGPLSIRKQEAQTEVNVQEVMDAFWDSKESICRTTTFEQQPATITFKIRASHTSETTRTALQRVQAAMETYRSVMTSATEERIDLVIKYGATVADMHPFAKVAFTLVTLIFDLLKEQQKYDGTVSDLASGIGRILPFAKEVVGDVLYDETKLLDEAVRKLFDLIGDAAEFICDYAKRSPVRRVAKAVISLEDHRRINDLQDDFAKLKEDFDRAVDVAALKIARDNGRKISSLARDQEFVEDFRLLGRLKPIDAPSYQEDRSCMEGTREGLLDDLSAWAVRLSSHVTSSNRSYVDNIFWLYGIPGVGKTYVANSLCRRLHKSGNLGGTFFCRRDDPNLSEPKRVLPTLMYRLAEMWGPYRKVVARALRDDPQLNPDSTGSELLLKLLESLKEHPPGALVLVIDALDECGEPRTRGRLLTSLMEVCSSIHWLKIVVTSRQERDITPLFGKLGIAGRDLAMEKQAREDIRLFTSRRMASIGEDRNLEPDWPGEERLDQIVARSGGLFIFVNTLCLLVDDPDPEEPLNMVLTGASEEASAELHNLYSTILRSRVGRSKEKFQSLARAIVVVATYRPLCDDTLASLIGLEPRIVRSWVDELSSLLYRDASNNDGIRVRHLSVIDFLTGPACPQEFQVDRQQGNAELALACLTTMTRKLEFNICKLETSCVSNAEIPGLEERVRQGISDPLQYSCMHWSSHLCFDSDPASTEASRLLDTFLMGEWPVLWLEVLSLMGKTPVAISSLKQIKASTKKLRDHHQHQVDDILHFVLAFYTPISASTPHIYVSALSFLPTESKLWENVSKVFPRLFNVRKGRMQSWPALPDEWRGHGSVVNSVAYSPDGQRVVSGSSDTTIRIWDAETGAVVGEPLKRHTEDVTSVAYSPDGQSIVSGSADAAIRIWNAETGAAVGEPLTGHEREIISVAYSPDGQRIVSGSADKTIRIWNAETGEAVGEPLKGHTKAVVSVAYSSDGQRIVSGSVDTTIRIWDAKTGAEVGRPLKGHTREVTSIACSPDGQRIVSSSYDATIRIWDAVTGVAVGEPLKGHAKEVNCVAYSPESHYIASGSEDTTIRIWNAETGAAVGEPLKGHKDWVRSVAYSPDSHCIVSGSSDGMIRVWDVEKGAAVGEPLKGHAGSIFSSAYSPDGRSIVSGSSDTTIRIWNAETGAAVSEPLREHNDGVRSVTYSPDSQRIASGSTDATIRIWDAETGAAVGEPLKGHTDEVNSVAYSPDGRYIISGSDDATIRIWNAETGAAVGEPLKGHKGWVRSVTYSPDGRHIVSGSTDATIRIWNAETGAAMGEPLKGHTEGLFSVAFSPNGQRIVSGSSDTTIRIWNAETGEAVGEPLKGHSGSILSVAYSPDGRHIVSGSTDTTIRIWEAETGAAVGEPLKGHTKEVNSVAYAPDGYSIVSGSGDTTIRVWEVGNGVEDDRSGLVSGSNSRDLDAANSLGRTGTSVTAFSGLPIPIELLDENGWVHDEGELLFWVPEDCRNGLTSPAIMTIPDMGRHRHVRLDFTLFRYGTSWTEVYGRGV